MIRKFLESVFIFTFSMALYANPTVQLVTPSLGFIYNTPFSINVVFSEAVTGFNSSDVIVANGTVKGITGSKANYTIQILPVTAGQMTVSIPENVVKSISTGESNEASKTLSLQALDPKLHPSSNLDISRFEITLPLPIGGIGQAEEQESNVVNGNPAKNTGYVNSPYFYTDSQTGSMNFFAPTGGATTRGSDFSRCELSEEQRLAWMLRQPFSNNLMTASVLIDRLPSNNIITIGQIHDEGNTDPFGHTVTKQPLVKVVYENNPIVNNQICGGCVHAQIRSLPTTPDNQQMDVVIKVGLEPGTVFTYSIGLTSAGKLTIKVLDKSQTFMMSTNSDNTKGWGSQSFLYHAGSYLHESGASTTEGGKVKFFYLSVQHTV